MHCFCSMKTEYCVIMFTYRQARNICGIEQFCFENETFIEDVMIILGDAGINYYHDGRNIWSFIPGSTSPQ